VETLLAVTILLVGFLALTQTVVSTQSLKSSSDMGQRLHAAVRRVAEEVRVVARGLRDEDDWSAAVVAAFSTGGSHGDSFAVPGLTPPVGMAAVGRIEVVVDETQTDAALGAPIGMPMDLDGDGAALTSDVTSNAQILPVVVSLTWRAPAGERRHRHVILVSRN